MKQHDDKQLKSCLMLGLTKFINTPQVKYLVKRSKFLTYGIVGRELARGWNKLGMRGEGGMEGKRRVGDGR